MPDYYKQYYDWIDWSVYDGLSDDERDALEAEHVRKYGLNHVLKPDAPPEAVKAWKLDAEQTREAAKRGEIIN